MTSIYFKLSYDSGLRSNVEQFVDCMGLYHGFHNIFGSTVFIGTQHGVGDLFLISLLSEKDLSPKGVLHGFIYHMAFSTKLSKREMLL